MIKVAIVGPESTGKSTLSQSLAQHYKTLWAEEYAREYLTSIGNRYKQEDLVKIAEGQLKNVANIQRQANDKQLIFLDTDLFVIKVWSEFKYGSCDPWILQQLDMNLADLYLLTSFDIPYEEDPLRENPDDRPQLFEIYEKELKHAGVPYLVVNGQAENRLQQATSRINDIL